MAKYNYNPAPGAQTPGKYPVQVGDNYRRYGEQPGYVYYPWNDQYYVDPKAQESYYESIGQGKPKEPGMLEQLAPVAAGAGAIGLVSGFAKDPSGFVNGIGGMFSGGADTVAAETAATQAAAPVVQAGATTGTGMLTGGATGAPATPNLISATPTGGASSGAASSLPTIGSALDTGAGIYAAGYTADQLGDAFFGGRAGRSGENQQRAVMTTGGAVGGGLLGSLVGMPGTGAAVGARVGNFIGKNELASTILMPVSALPLLFGSKQTWRREGNKLNSLAEDGVYVPENLLNEITQKPRSKEELIRKDLPIDFVGRDENGNWVNNLFANDRRVENLRPTDLVNYSVFAEKDPEWFRKSIEEREKVAADVLAAGAVTEGHGTISVDWNKMEQPQAEGAATKGAGVAQVSGPLSPVGQPGAPAAIPPRGTRLSPGIYADGKGGSYRA